MAIVLEICAGDYGSALTAARCGAGRVELCSGLDEGGLTPSLGLIKTVCRLDGIRKHVLIRPRGGDFLYTPAEQDIMVEDIRLAREAGADGIVVGALRADGSVDEDAMSRFIAAADGCSVTFHRAFDLCACPEASLERIIALGCRRLLTSGCSSTAEAGIPMLRKLVEQAANRIIIMPGCGIGAMNVASIVRQTGVGEVHASARTMQHSGMRFRQEGVTMGKGGADEYAMYGTSEEKVKEILQALSVF